MTSARALVNQSISFLGIAAAGAVLAACGSTKADNPDSPPAAARILNLDSLNQEVSHKDSVESNTVFYDEAFQAYRKKFPNIDKNEYFQIASGKDQEFCLFKPDPAATCLETGDKFNNLNLKPPAKDAYHAGLLSEGYNQPAENMRLWASMGQLSMEEKEYDRARIYLWKILELEPKNKWAKKSLAAISKN